MASGRLDLDSNELSLIDSGIQDIQDVPLRPHLVVLNLHSNYIQQIHNLSRLQQLRHLDLSSNQITRIEGLEGLVSLRTLNLSCNLIAEVHGLSPLRSLVKINLSYNQIGSVEGFSQLTGPQYKLSHIELHGNKLRSLTHVTQALIGCFNLRHLVLYQDGSGNPVCHQPGYPSEVFSALPQVKCLDGKDRVGRPADMTEVLNDIPGLEDYMEYLISSSSSDPQLADVITPKIDQALTAFRQRHLVSGEISTTVSSTDIEQSPVGVKEGTWDQESRLQQLEGQLAQLLHKQQKSPSCGSQSSEKTLVGNKGETTGRNSLQAAKDADETGESSSDVINHTKGKKTGRKGKKSKVPTYTKTTNSSRAKSEEHQAGNISSNTPDGDEGSGEGERQLQVKAGSEKRYREDIKTTYVHLMQELEEERERRWKAEQAAKKLADHICAVQAKAKQDSDTKTTALEATGHLKRAVMNEREVKMRLQEENQTLKDRIGDLTDELTNSKANEQSHKLALRAMEETVLKQERERVKQEAHEVKKLQEAQMKAAAMTREAEMLRHTTENQKGQLGQLQELLAAREQEHRQELKHRYSLGSPELQQQLQKEAEVLASHHQQNLTQQKHKIDELTRQYGELEDEFRLALQIEANRFSELKTAFEKTRQENEDHRQLIMTAQKKDEKSSAMISELTALVKEQKGRITELTKSKHEQNVDFRERVTTLEAHVEEARKRMVQLELLKKEKAHLSAEVHAQESVIDGLKAERKLWGQELAQQGSSLAQDRGRLESRIEILNQENATLKKQLERETDGLRIKSKVIDDQTETVRKLKEGLVERDGEIRKAREETLKVQQDLEAQLLEERTANQDTQDAMDHLRGRKDELKREVSSLRDELAESQKAHSILNTRWREKSALIGQLEHQVSQMKDSWEGKEEKLTGERNKAIEAANLAIEKLRGMDDAFRKQLEAKEKSHQEEINLVKEQKERELQEANRRVALVENEMRELLRETESNKRAMEDKLKHLTHALGDLQSDLF
ncbi:leucine-rich repeat and coiled-coil domain-containing protein 1-like [Haliotis rufescens]|uniref:leucine-rich repeat and coiled-coil domain-containing protein 1-like n=1 Tax=Haliotis rufescens TaxID=6454 RepID=UPI00201F43CE|nr:leucine-rich repeat and coiled-coil domain-containing protein 1-like [Haliotis rufescens]XP_048254924.1 leucine-rich repeat and coiled-coil domain-containing protein 1-like [Haliotis rufescens]